MPEFFDFADLSWMSGRWTCRIFGGEWEEYWSPPTANSLQGHGRLIVEGATTFLEFMAVELDQTGLPILFMILGSPSTGQKSPKAFAAADVASQKVVFARSGTDFPQTISYLKTETGMICELAGTEDGQRKVERFDFERLGS